MHPSHPRFFAFIPSPGNFVSAMADALVSGFNPFAGIWIEGAGPSQIELNTIEWLCRQIGLPDSAGGLFVSGGSAANLTALAHARHQKLQDDFQDAVFYFSDQTHSSIEKAIKLQGFNESHMRRLPSDEQYRLQLSDLKEAVNEDRAEGKRPFCVVANAGTTNTGAVDPLRSLSDYCGQENLWLHVDGAFGASAALCNRGKKILTGLESVDSLSIDPHKWLFQPYEMGCVLVKDRQALKDTYRILPEYLEDTQLTEEEVNFCDYGIQLTRSFRALKLWMSLQIFGVEAFRQAVEKGFSLAEYAQDVILKYKEFEIVTPAQMAVITFRYVIPGKDDKYLDDLNERIVDAMIRGGFAMIISTVLRGRRVLRICTTNPRTTQEDIRATIERIKQFGDELCDGRAV